MMLVPDLATNLSAQACSKSVLDLARYLDLGGHNFAWPEVVTAGMGSSGSSGCTSLRTASGVLSHSRTTVWSA